MDSGNRESNYSFCARGRIWLGWKPDIVDLTILHIIEQFIHCEISNLVNNTIFRFTVVYGLHTIDDKKQLWSGLGNINALVSNLPWLLFGDFYSVLNVTDRVYGAAISLNEIRDFSNFVSFHNLPKLKSSSHFFSWHKGGGEAKTASRIDMCFGNASWITSRGLFLLSI